MSGSFVPQPCVCTRELCVFAFQTLGVMADAAEAIATDADVSCFVSSLIGAGLDRRQRNALS